jgi:hypothetical protein
MDKLRLAAQQALETFEKFVSNVMTVGQRYTNEGEQILVSIYKLRAALAEQDVSLIDEGKKAEPVAWGIPNIYGEIYDVISPDEHAREPGQYTVPLYAAPQPRREVELTDEDIDQLMADALKPGQGHSLRDWARRIEAAHGIKGETK